MSLIYYKILAGILILITSILAVAYPLKIRAVPSHHRALELGDALASGIFLGAALFHMLPSAIADFSTLFSNLRYPLAELFCSAGFLLLLFFERVSNNTASHDHVAVPYVVTFIIIIHSFVEGAALGVNPTFATASIIFLAIIAHKGSESFMLAITLTRSNLALKQILVLIFIFASMTPLGILVGADANLFLQAETGKLVTASLNAFAAGTFLYMSTLHHINHHQREHHGEGLLEFGALLVGLLIMAGLAIVT